MAGVLVVLLAWWLGPGLFGAAEKPQQEILQAKVMLPVPCAGAEAQENVQVTVNGEQKDVTLSGCGHTAGEVVNVSMVANPVPGEAEVRIAETVQATSDGRRPVGLGLLALSCVAGGTYTYLLLRDSAPRRRLSPA